MIYDSISELPDRYKSAIVEAVNLIINRQIQGLVKVVLFGSCARLHLHVGSDIDLLIVTDNIIEDRRLISYIRSDLEFLPDDMKGDIVFTNKECFEKSTEKLHKDIRRDGIILWNRGKYTDEYKQLLSPSKE
ncbi:MAG: nucleotidyltransferase domain-containing protein [Clostridiales bacterium]|nr:nucleotidyltransferase domain-containing protein [Clostridiales bacterium]